MLQLCQGGTSTKQGLMCLAQGQNSVTPVKLESAPPGLQSSSVPLSHWAPIQGMYDGQNDGKAIGHLNFFKVCGTKSIKVPY